MQKQYIFLVHSINRIGGSELYLSRKIEYLISQGWECNVFFYIYIDGEIIIPNLKQFIKNYIPQLRQTIGNVTEKKVNKVIKKIITEKNNYGDVMIESFNMTLATWGEHIAKICHAKHLVYIIDEYISYPTKIMKEFIIFKLNQKLLYCIRNSVLNNTGINLKVYGDVSLKAIGCSTGNVIDYNYPLDTVIRENSINILSLGRLDKPYIKHLFESIVIFANNNKDKEFNLIIVGDTPNTKLRLSLLAIIKNIPNLTFSHLGNVWPLPKKLFDGIDVMAGSAGCVIISYREGIPSIAIDSKDFEAIGIYGITTNNTFSRDKNDVQTSIIDLLHDVIIKKKYYKSNPLPEPINDFSHHQKIIDQNIEQKYYDTISSKHYLSHIIIRKIAVAVDTNKFGHLFVTKLWSSNLFKKIVKKLNRTDLNY